MNRHDIRSSYTSDGYNILDASSKACQDILLLKIGRFSTRYKDLFDFYYFINSDGLDKSRLIKCFAEYILDVDGMKEASISDIHKRLFSIFKNRAYIRRADTVRNNWLGVPISEVTERILEYIEELNS